MLFREEGEKEGGGCGTGDGLWPCDGADERGNAAAETNRRAVHAQFGIPVIVCEAQEHAVASNVDAPPPFVVDFRWTKKISRKNHPFAPNLLNSFGTMK